MKHQKKGQKRNDTNIRVFTDYEDLFLDKWHLLEMKVVDDKMLPKDTMTNADVSCLNGQAVMSLLLGAIRAERLCAGAINNFLETGCIHRWLSRLQEIRDI